MPVSPRPPRELDAPHRVELFAIYAKVDALLAPFTCEGSAECCRFGVTGREPYPTAVELDVLSRAVRAANVAPKRRRALPLADERPCPLLSPEGRCRVYAARPFGCRTFFCDRALGPGKLPRAEIQRLSRAVADLSARFDPQNPHPRPLTRALGFDR